MTILAGRFGSRRRAPDETAPTSRRRPRVFSGLVVGGLFVAVVLWMVVSLLLADSHLHGAAGAMRRDLNRYRDALLAGDTATAGTWLNRARAELRDAHADVANAPADIARHLPVLSSSMRDVSRLLRAADILMGVAGDTYSLYGEVGGAGHNALFKNSTFNIPAIEAADREAHQIVQRMARARSLLLTVHGGIFESGVPDARNKALGQIVRVNRDVRGALTILDVLPTLVGAGKPQTYLVVILNPAEERFSGGAPLGIVAMSLTDGHLKVVGKGQTSRLTGKNSVESWVSVHGDVWLGNGQRVRSRFVDANFNPDFRIAGEEMRRAYEAEFDRNIDGVIAVTPQAIADMLKATGPLSTRGYGKLTADNLVSTLIGQAYLRFPPAVRHSLNTVAIESMLHALTHGGHLLGKARALNVAVPGRYLQVYFHDPKLERLVLAHHLGGALPGVGGDFAGVFTQNVNESKADYNVTRDVAVRVQLAADGSAVVTRTVTMTNHATTYTGPGHDLKRGDYTVWDSDLVAVYFPTRARLLTATLNGSSLAVHRHVVSYGGLSAWSQVVWLGPGRTITLVVRYALPNAVTLRGTLAQVSVAAPTQAVVQPGSFALTVSPPPGDSFRPVRGWQLVGRDLTMQEPQSRDLILYLTLTRSWFR